MTRATRKHHLMVWLMLGPLALLVLILGVLEARHRRAVVLPAAVGGMP